MQFLILRYVHLDRKFLEKFLRNYVWIYVCIYVNVYKTRLANNSSSTVCSLKIKLFSSIGIFCMFRSRCVVICLAIRPVDGLDLQMFLYSLKNIYFKQLTKYIWLCFLEVYGRGRICTFTAYMQTLRITNQQNICQQNYLSIWVIRVPKWLYWVR